MSEFSHSNGPAGGDNPSPVLSQRVVAFQAAWGAGLRPRIEEHLLGVPANEISHLLCVLVRIDAHHRFLNGENPSLEEYQSRFRHADPALLSRSLEAASESSRSVRPPERPDVLAQGETLIRHVSTPKYVGCPRCQNPVSLPARPSEDVLCEACGNAFRLDDVCEGSTTAFENRVLGRFQLIRQIGIGSFGTVWQARDPQLDRTVAIKVLHGHLANSDVFRDRFQREARAAAQLEHPGIVHLYEVPVVDGVPVLVSDFIDGVSLQELIKAGRYSFEDVATLIAAIADALDYAHRRGLVHRDIKPANVMVVFPLPEDGHEQAAARDKRERVNSLSGKPVIVDFGLALRDTPETAMTMDGQIVGTPAYISPEQIRQAHKVDGRSDIYSLGVVLYEMISGELPFRGSKTMILHQVLHDEPRSPRSLNDKIPLDLETIALKAMAKLPTWRYSSAKEMADDLGRYLRHEPILARPTGPVERAWRWCRRNPLVASLIVAVAASLLGGTSAASIFAIRERERSRELIKRGEELAQRVDERDQAARKAALSEERLRQQWYDAEIGLAQRDYSDGRIDWLLPRLAALQPTEVGGRDLRGFEWPYLQRLARQDLETLNCPSEVLAVAVSGNGRTMTYGCADGSLHFWDFSLARERISVTAHRGAVTCVAFHPDGRQLFSGGADGKVKRWNVTSATYEGELLSQKPAISSLAISQNGALLVAATREAGDGKIRVPGKLHFLSPKSGKQTRPPLPMDSRNPRIALSPDGNCVAWFTDGSVPQVFDCQSGQASQPSPAQSHPLAAVASGANGRLIAWGGDGEFIRIWDRTTRKVTTAIGTGRGFAIKSLAFSGDKRIAAGSKEGPVQIFDVQTGAELLRLAGHTDGAYSVAFTPDGRRLISGGAEGTVKIWDAVSGVEPVALKGDGSVFSTVYDSKGRLAFAASGEIMIWDAQARRQLLRIGPVPSAHALAFSPDERRLISGHSDGHLRVWDATTGEKLADVPGHNGIVSSVLFAHGGKLLISGGFDRAIKIWDSNLKSWGFSEQDTSFAAPPSTTGVRCLSLSGDGKLLAVAGYDGTASIWSFAEKRIIRVFRGHHGPVFSVAFQPRTTSVASGGADGDVWLWDAITGEIKQTLKGNTNGANVLCFSPDGRRLAVADYKRGVRLWDVSTGRDLLRLEGHTGPVFALAFSADGMRFVTGCNDGIVRIWDARPLTSDILVERDARSLVSFLVAMEPRPADIVGRIQQDHTVRETVRQVAIEMAQQPR